MLPSQLISSLQQVKGFNQEAFIQVHQSGEKLTSIRVNPAKAAEQLPFSGEPVAWCKYGYYLQERPSFTMDPIFHAGAYYVQEASSMFLWQALQQTVKENTNKKVLDLCAAPGGKSTLLASWFSDNSLVVSNDVIKSRANILTENITKWGSDNVVVTNNDPKDFVKLGAYFDVIVADAPCSGSGLFRKDPAAITEWSENNVALCSQRQQRILADVFPSLKQNGILIYSTCSYSKQENEEICDWLVTEFAMENIQLNMEEAWGIVETVSHKHKAFGYRFYPDKVKGEGFFIAVFKKTQEADDARLKEMSLLPPSKKEQEAIDAFIQLPDDYTIFTHTHVCKAIKKNLLSDIKILSQYLYIKKAGVALGELKGKDFIPHHELALSYLPLQHFNAINFNLEDALQYLRKKEVKVTDTPKGWTLVKYNGYVLGWIKVLPNRINNYYPGEWRILKS